MCEICEKHVRLKENPWLTWLGGGRSFTTVVIVTLNTFRRIGDDIEYRLDVCRTATWLPTYRFIKKETLIVLCFVSYFTTYCILNVGDTSSVTLYYLGYEINTDRLRETWEDNKCTQNFTLKTWRQKPVWRPGRRWDSNVRNFKQAGCKGELDLSGFAQNPMADSCDDGKEPSGCIKLREFLD